MMPFRFARGARQRGEVASSKASARFRVSALLRAVFRDRSGVSGLEFAMVGPIFLLLIFGVIENGLTLWTQSVLDNATRDASRLLQTGQAQNGGTSFVTQLCNEVSGLMSCSALQYRVQTGASFAGMSPTIATGSGGTLTGFSKYPTSVSGGTAGQDTLIQVVYTRTYIIPWVGKMMSASGSEQLLATATFQVEPY
jgi:Flp pilus assembly protein TadG